jgi:putative ABC transport system substrate-binding protein
MIPRRQFITLLSGAAAWPLAARGQQGDRVRRIGVLIGARVENDPTGIASVSAFTRALEQLGWTNGRNVRIDIRWAAADVELNARFAKELVGFQPDVILSESTPGTAAVKRETKTIPIVFVVVADPIGEGFASSLAHPGGNLTGFTYVESAMIGKWFQLLTEMAPSIKRIAMIFNPATAPGGGSYFLPYFETAARSFKVEPIIAPVHSDADIESVITALGREPKGGFVLQTDAFLFARQAAIILRWQPKTMCQLFIRGWRFRATVVCFPTEQTWKTFGGARHPMSIVSSVAPSPRTFRSNCRSNFSWP